ncbi:MAG: nucleotide pyrophosphohydrolase [Nitrospirae bacterium RBG_16_64_22]|nr:MAG: nucleotide pyrophosphohydrolase [Nitrospirae bacterium RBG_16_64_22]
MPNDEILESLLAFRRERDWEKFHTPKDLAISIVLEAAELLEEFQWKNREEVARHLEGEGRARVAEELADLGIYLKLLAHDLGIDLEDAMRRKIEKNRAKYPVEKSRGTAKKYNEL